MLLPSLAWEHPGAPAKIAPPQSSPPRLYLSYFSYFSYLSYLS